MPPAKAFLWSAVVTTFLLCARSGSAQNLSAQDRGFIENAAKTAMMDVQMGHVGVEKGLSSEVQSLAQNLIDDHTKENEDLASLAKEKGVTLPTLNPPIPKHLQSKTGEHFDKAFTGAVKDDHERMIKEFEKEISSGSDPDLKEWATKTLPILRTHLDVARALKQLM